MNAGSGQNLNWFFNNWFFTNNYIDLKINNVKKENNTSNQLQMLAALQFHLI